MDQEDIDRAVAAATGESVLEINRRGFVLANLPEPNFDPEPTAWRHDVDRYYGIETQLQRRSK